MGTSLLAQRARERERALAMADLSDDDDEPLKKKKKKKKSAAPQPQKMGGLKPRTFSASELKPFRRVLWEEHDDEAVDEADLGDTRRRLGLRVPDVRKLPCKFWQRGECARGAACSFAHAAAGAEATTARCPPPVASLSTPGLPRSIGRAMLHFGHREPSPIQAQAWPAALRGHDLLCRAPTGSGKTLGYLLPAAAHALAAPPAPAGCGPVALVLVPTRELAMQVLGVARALRRPCSLRSEALYGGEPREEQCEVPHDDLT
jgi:hypothetical protein